MVVESLADGPLVMGIVFGLIGVGIWIGGLLFFNWVWQRYRGDGDGSGQG